MNREEKAKIEREIESLALEKEKIIGLGEKATKEKNNIDERKKRLLDAYEMLDNEKDLFKKEKKSFEKEKNQLKTLKKELEKLKKWLK